MIERALGLLDAHEELLWALGAGSLLMLLVSALVVPFIVVRLPADFYSEGKIRSPRLFARHPALRLALLVAKNVLGATLLLAGLAMLVLPGQGILTILLALALLDFPGKRRLELRILRARAVQRSMNWLRRRARKEPLRF